MDQLANLDAGQGGQQQSGKHFQPHSTMPATNRHLGQRRKQPMRSHPPLLIGEHCHIHQPALHCIHGRHPKQLKGLPHMRFAGSRLQVHLRQALSNADDCLQLPNSDRDGWDVAAFCGCSSLALQPQAGRQGNAEKVAWVRCANITSVRVCQSLTSAHQSMHTTGSAHQHIAGCTPPSPHDPLMTA